MFNSLNLSESFDIPIAIFNCKESFMNKNAIFRYKKKDFVIYWNGKPEIFPYYCPICGYAYKLNINDIIKCECHQFDKNRENPL